MITRTTGILPASVAQAERLAADTWERIANRVLDGAKFAHAFIDEMQRCRKDWRHLDEDTYDLAIDWAGDESEIRHLIEQRRAQRKPWWRFW